MKFHVYIIFWTRSCLIIQSYSSGGATFPDFFASFTNPLHSAQYDGSPVAGLPGPRFSRPLGLVWDLSIDYG